MSAGRLRRVARRPAIVVITVLAAVLFGSLLVSVNAKPAQALENGKAKFADGCVYVVANINASSWKYYCPDDDASENNWVWLRGPNEERWNGDVYQSRAGKNWQFEQGTTGAYQDMARAHWAWAGVKDMGGEAKDPYPDTRKVKPTNSGHDQRSLMDDANAGVDNACEGFMNEVIKKSQKKMTCIDPRFNYPCPSPPIKGTNLLKACTEQNKVVIDHFLGKYPDGPSQKPCDAAAQQESGCDPGTGPGGNGRGDLVTSQEDKVGGPGFLEDPPKWTKFQLSNATANLITMWIKSPNISLTGDDKYGSGQTYSLTRRLFNPLAVGVFILSSAIAVMYVARTRKGEPFGKLALAGGGFILFGGVGAVVTDLGNQGSTALSNWIIIMGLNPPKPDGTNATDQYTLAQTALEDGVRGISATSMDLSFFLFIFASLFLIVGSVTQYVYIIARDFVLVVAPAAAPLAAASSATERGASWVSNLFTVWLAALAYKPASTTIFVMGIRLATPKGNQPLELDEQFRGFLFIAFVSVLGPAFVVLIFSFTERFSGSVDANLALTGGLIAAGAKPVSGAIRAAGSAGSWMGAKAVGAMVGGGSSGGSTGNGPSGSKQAGNNSGNNSGNNTGNNTGNYQGPAVPIGTAGGNNSNNNGNNGNNGGGNNPTGGGGQNTAGGNNQAGGQNTAGGGNTQAGGSTGSTSMDAAEFERDWWPNEAQPGRGSWLPYREKVERAQNLGLSPQEASTFLGVPVPTGADPTSWQPFSDWSAAVTKAERQSALNGVRLGTSGLDDAATASMPDEFLRPASGAAAQGANHNSANGSP